MIKKMTVFKNTDELYEVEDHLFWIYRTTYEIEMHINTVLSLNSLVSDENLISDLTTDMIFYHNELALIRTAHILKNKPRDDEKHSLNSLKNYLDGRRVNKSKKSMKLIYDKISALYEKHQIDITRLINKRDAGAHEFKINEQIKISQNNKISFNRQINLIQEAREIINELYHLLFERELPSELKYPIDLYEKIYKHSIEIIASEARILR